MKIKITSVAIKYLNKLGRIERTDTHYYSFRDGKKYFKARPFEFGTKKQLKEFAHAIIEPVRKNQIVTEVRTTAGTYFL